MISKRNSCHQNVTEITVRTHWSWRIASWLLILEKENLTAAAAMLERGENVVGIAGSCSHSALKEMEMKCDIKGLQCQISEKWELELGEVFSQAVSMLEWPFRFVLFRYSLSLVNIVGDFLLCLREWICEEGIF